MADDEGRRPDEPGEGIDQFRSVARDEEGAAAEAELAAGGVEAGFVCCDLADPSATHDAFDRLERDRGTPSILVNGAAINPHLPSFELTVETWQRMASRPCSSRSSKSNSP